MVFCAFKLLRRETPLLIARLTAQFNFVNFMF